MTRKIAEEIAETFILIHNPNAWDGKGNMDKDFSTEIEVHNFLDENVYMTIQFEIDADEGGNWAHEVKLYSKAKDELIDGYFGYGIDSPKNLADTILDLYENCT